MIFRKAIAADLFGSCNSIAAAVMACDLYIVCNGACGFVFRYVIGSYLFAVKIKPVPHHAVRAVAVHIGLILFVNYIRLGVFFVECKPYFVCNVGHSELVRINIFIHFNTPLKQVVQ